MQVGRIDGWAPVLSKWYIGIYQSCVWSSYGLNFNARGGTDALASAHAFFLQAGAFSRAPVFLLHILFPSSQVFGTI